MKKFFLLITTLFLFSPSAIICSTKKIEQDSQTNIFSEVNIDDDFDSLIEEAIENNLIKNVAIEEPSKFKILAQKIGIILFLRPYIFIVTKYRCVKNFIKTSAQKLVAYFSKKETETNEQTE